jgi:putative membrane protein
VTRHFWLTAALASMTLATSAWAQPRTWEGRWEVHPLWWPFVLLAAALVLLILFVWALLQVLPLVLAILGAVLGVRWLLRASDHSSDRAVSLLRERYARGEISREEFEARLRDLRAAP